jgi:hypothetical protein
MPVTTGSKSAEADLGYPARIGQQCAGYPPMVRLHKILHTIEGDGPNQRF